MGNSSTTFLLILGIVPDVPVIFDHMYFLAKGEDSHNTVYSGNNSSLVLIFIIKSG